MATPDPISKQLQDAIKAETKQKLKAQNILNAAGMALHTALDTEKVAKTKEKLLAQKEFNKIGSILNQTSQVQESYKAIKAGQNVVANKLVIENTMNGIITEYIELLKKLNGEIDKEKSTGKTENAIYLEHQIKHNDTFKQIKADLDANKDNKYLSVPELLQLKAKFDTMGIAGGMMSSWINDMLGW